MSAKGKIRVGLDVDVSAWLVVEMTREQLEELQRAPLIDDDCLHDVTGIDLRDGGLDLIDERTVIVVRFIREIFPEDDDE